MNDSLKNSLANAFNFRPNRNQLRDLGRLIFEISRRENVSITEIIHNLENNANIEKYNGRNKFFAIKKALIQRRFPITAKIENIDTKKVFLNKISSPLEDNWQVKREFSPLEVLIEKDAKDELLIRRFKEKFPNAKLTTLDYYSEYLKRNKFSISQLKKPLIFLVKEKWDFLKMCPCTRHHLRCGYWILNLGFGCPFDCSYCFLQHYTNFPGIILPTNLDDFFTKSDSFFKKLKKPIRIGTGEFSDSLALDAVTNYSLRLIPYFKNKNVVFELKTKSTQISNILKMEPSPNIIISWSLNPAEIIKNEELGAPDLAQRLSAAKSVQDKGYKVAFHFDPIIHFDGWQHAYELLIKELYANIRPPFAWISLGTLRANRQLKSIVEQRFPKSNIFYGELFIGKDKKLRYPKFLRLQIYQNMIKWIRMHDWKTPIYLCMEDKETWDVLGKFNSTEEIENYILKI